MIFKKIFDKLFHPPEYPAELPSKQGKLSYWYQWHMRLMDMGRGHVVGKVTQLIPEYGIAILLLDKWGIPLTMNQTLMFFIIMMCTVWLLGWCYVMLKQDVVQAILNRYRDVMFKDIYDRVKNNDEKNR